MRCLSDEQFERLSAKPDGAGCAKLLAHVRGCQACGRRLEQARSDAELVNEIRELRQRREGLEPMVEALTDGARGSGGAASDRV